MTMVSWSAIARYGPLPRRPAEPLQPLEDAGRGQRELRRRVLRGALAAQHGVDVPDGGAEGPLVGGGALDDRVGPGPHDGEGVGGARVKRVGQLELARAAEH